MVDETTRERHAALAWLSDTWRSWGLGEWWTDGFAAIRSEHDIGHEMLEWVCECAEPCGRQPRGCPTVIREWGWEPATFARSVASLMERYEAYQGGVRRHPLLKTQDWQDGRSFVAAREFVPEDGGPSVWVQAKYVRAVRQTWRPDTWTDGPAQEGGSWRTLLAWQDGRLVAAIRPLDLTHSCRIKAVAHA